MKILAIGAHPDDIEIFMFGFLSVCKKRSDEIFMTVVTDGAKGGQKNIEELINVRKKETINGLKFLGEPTFLNLRDGDVGNSEKDFTIINENLYKVKPDLIVTHHQHDYHSDHVAVSNLVKKAAGHYIPILYCDTMMGVNFDPLYYVDITVHFKLKVKAIMEHNSQKPNRFVSLSKLMNSYRSAQCNAPLGCYAEAYTFEKSFPFSDISNILPQPIPIRPFDINNHNGFL